MGRRAQTHCQRNHEYTAANTAYRGVMRHKVCRQCEKLRRDRARRQRAYAAWEEKS